MLIDKKTLSDGRRLLGDLAKNSSGLAAVEFAVSLPFFLGLTVAGMETANFASTVMQVNQLAIHTADSAARMGANDAAQIKTIDESDINDVFAGMMREGQSFGIGEQHLYKNPTTGVSTVRGNAKIWLSSVEPVDPFVAATPKYRMRWQRCAGTATHFTPTYGTPATKTNVDGIGPTGRLTVAPPAGAVMFVEIQYHYKPMLLTTMGKVVEQDMTKHASMVVRDIRDYTGGTNGVYPKTGATAATC
jgi:Flp pilus assembly protein TadG